MFVCDNTFSAGWYEQHGWWIELEMGDLHPKCASNSDPILIWFWFWSSPQVCIWFCSKSPSFWSIWCHLECGDNRIYWQSHWMKWCGGTIGWLEKNWIWIEGLGESTRSTSAVALGFRNTAPTPSSNFFLFPCLLFWNVPTYMIYGAISVSYKPWNLF